MKKIIIFGGTTEGRLLSERLRDSGIPHIVSVATEYGAGLLDMSPLVTVRVGRLDRAEMEAYLIDTGFGRDDIIIDATHPYASEVSENIRSVAESMNVKVLRVLRRVTGDAQDQFISDGQYRERFKGMDLRSYEDIRFCSQALHESVGNILLTTGSRDLHLLTGELSPEELDRIYVRVLPSAESLELCHRAHIRSDHIIAMQGPFTSELNQALIRQFNISHLVTKESGDAGGFAGKLEACAACGITCHVILPPVVESGVSVEEAFRHITGGEYRSGHTERESDRVIYLAGFGPGGKHTATEEVRALIGSADAVFGSSRLVEGIKGVRSYPYYRAEDIIPILEKEESLKKIVILFSGDSSFYSGARSMREALIKWHPDEDIRILPGISSLSYLAAKTGISLDDAAVMSIHGRNSDADLHRLSEMVRYRSRTFVLMSGDEDIRRMAKGLAGTGLSCRICIGRNLSYPDESLLWLSPDEAAGYTGDGLLAALVINTAPQRRPIINVLRDSDLIRDRVPMTKACVRHEAVIRLELEADDVVYDIGGGTGSVALEIAGLDPSLTVYTVEKDPNAAALIRKNIEALKADNCILVEGEAPGALEGMEKPDSVFIGGSSGNLLSIIDAVRAKGDGIRFVITAVSLETAETVRHIMHEKDASDIEMIQLQVSNMEQAGRHHLMKAENPVFIFSFTL